MNTEDDLFKYARYAKIVGLLAFVIFIFVSVNDFKEKKMHEIEVVSECAKNSFPGSKVPPCDPIEELRKSHKYKQGSIQ